MPLLRPEAPIVGTGMEHKICMDSEVVVLAEGDGIVTQGRRARHHRHRTTTARRRNIKLTKFLRSNHGTCINQNPIVDVGERVHGRRLNENGVWEDPTVLADGPATDQGEIALGRNILVGFMTWEGYNYEDAVLLNERLVREDVLHLHPHRGVRDRRPRYQARARKRSPATSPTSVKTRSRDLDERGIIRVGAEVHAGDILVGKVTPKGETDLTAEERLLRAIFGEKAREVRDTSLKCAPRRVAVSSSTQRSLPAKTAATSSGPGVNQGRSLSTSRSAARFQPGDKMAGRHGNKGVVSRDSAAWRICPSCPTVRRWISC